MSTAPSQFQMRIPRRLSLLLLGTACASIVLNARVVMAQANSAPASVEANLYDSASVREAQRRLGREIPIVWEQKPLREALAELSDNHSIPIWLDRRIDPNERLNVVSQGRMPINQILKQLASLVDADAGLVENIIYFCPKGELQRVQVAAVKLHQLDCKRVGNNDLRHTKFSWQELATPTEVLTQIGADLELKISAELPHDLLHAGDVGTCTLATQLTLLCAGFGKQAFLRGGVVTIDELADQLRWSYTYNSRETRAIGSNRAAVAKLARKHSGQIRVRANGVTVSGPTSLHLEMLSLAHSQRSQSPSSRSQSSTAKPSLYALQVKNKSAETVLASLANSIGFQLSWNSDVPAEKRQRLISFEVQDADVEDLLNAVAKAAQLKVTRDGDSVRVSDVQ